MKWVARILATALLLVWFYVVAWLAGAAWGLLSDAFMDGVEAVQWLV